MVCSGVWPGPDAGIASLLLNGFNRPSIVWQERTRPAGDWKGEDVENTTGKTMFSIDHVRFPNGGSRVFVTVGVLVLGGKMLLEQGLQSVPLKCPSQTESKVRSSREALIFKQDDARQSSQRKTAIAQDSVAAIDADMPTETLPVTFQVER